MGKKYIDKIVCVGCSHASDSYTPKSWPHWIGEHYQKEVEVLSSPGAGIQIGVDKLSLLLSKNTYHSVFFQVPHNVRLTVGMNSEKLIKTYETDMEWKENGNIVGEEFIMSLNPSNNIGAMTKFFGVKYEKLFKGFDKWYLRYVADNTYETEVRSMHNLFLAQELCKKNNIPYYIFFWHEQLSKRKHKHLFNAWYDNIDKTRIIENSVTEFLEENNYKVLPKPFQAHPVLPEWSVDGYHMNDEGSKLVVDNYVIPNVEKINDINSKQV